MMSAVLNLPEEVALSYLEEIKASGETDLLEALLSEMEFNFRDPFFPMLVWIMKHGSKRLKDFLFENLPSRLTRQMREELERLRD